MKTRHDVCDGRGRKSGQSYDDGVGNWEICGVCGAGNGEFCDVCGVGNGEICGVCGAGNGAICGVCGVGNGEVGGVCGNVEGLGKRKGKSMNGGSGRVRVVKGVVQEVEERRKMMVKAFEPLRVAYQGEMGRGMDPGNCSNLLLPFMKLPNQIH